MAPIYDTTFKELFAQNFVALLPWLLPDLKSFEVLKLPEELPVTARRADLMIRVERQRSRHGPRRPTSLIQIFECQCQQDALLPCSMLTRAVLAHDLYHLPVKTTLLALSPKAVIPSRYVFGEGDDGEELRHSVTVRRVFEESADTALASDMAELLPLVTTMQPRDGNQEALVQRVMERIVDQVIAAERRKVMLEQAANFARLRLPRTKIDGIVRDVLGRKRTMIDPLRDFPYVREGYRKGIREGESRGEAKGMAKGKAVGKAESVLMLLDVRGVTVSKALRTKILTCTDLDTLDRWLRTAASASSAAEVFAAQ